jgi:superfamily II DNA/RNA helicase
MEAEALTTNTWTMQDEPDAVAPAVAGPDGLAAGGTAANGTAASGIAPDRAANRIAPDRAADGTAPDGTTPSGAAPEAVAPDAAQLPASEKTFRDFAIAEPICAALEAKGIITAFPIQALTLPIALDGHDVIGQARTGTGKTFAFGIPILQHLNDAPDRPSAPRALIVVPTRELAIQVGDDLRIAGSRTGAKIVTLYGGRAYEPQIEALASVDIVVGTPGRLLDLSRQGHLDLSQVRALVLDEADKMLDLGFLPDVEKILKQTPPQRQTMLFSATMPGEVVTLARRHLRQPIHIRAEQHDEPAHVPTTEQHIFRAHQMDKIEVLARVLQSKGRGLTIVFCRTRRSCDQVATALTTRGFAAAAVHGDLGQSQRERAMRAFRSGKVDVLVATDVAARGLDVDDVTHVINHECPEDDKAYLHRIGRTARAGKTGVAVTFVDWHDMQRWKLINETLNLGHPEPVETYSTSDHLFSDLGIPQGARGTLPSAMRGRLGLEAEDLEDIGETGRSRSQADRGLRDRGSRDRGSRDRGAMDRTGRDRGPGDRGGRSADGGQAAQGQRGQRVRRRTRAGFPAGSQGEQSEPGAGPTAAAGSEPGAAGGRSAAATGSRSAANGSSSAAGGAQNADDASATAARPKRRRRAPRGIAREIRDAARAAAAADEG